MAGNGADPAAIKPHSLQTFKLDDLARFTAEGEFGPHASPDYRVLYVGRDDVHGALKYIFGLISVSLKMNMFGFDDEELNSVIMGLVRNPGILIQVSLDKSQAQGVHEKKILVGDILEDRQAFSSHFAVGESQTHQILHTKGGVLDNVLAFEGSTNWSASGEGSGIGLHGSPNLTGFRAQANSLTVHTNPYEIAKFAAVLDHWYDVAAAQPQPAYDQWASQGNGAEPTAAKPAGAHPAAGAAAH